MLGGQGSFKTVYFAFANVYANMTNTHIHTCYKKYKCDLPPMGMPTPGLRNGVGACTLQTSCNLRILCRCVPRSYSEVKRGVAGHSIA